MVLWLQVSDLKRGLETWKQQLENLILHCESLGPGQPRQATEDPEDLDARQSMEAGKRIKERFVELKCEYDGWIRQCADAMADMVMVAQLELNVIGQDDTQTNLVISRTNTAIAEATQADSRRMRSISMLTMVFLPATFVATVFSMTLFNWSPEQGQKVMSPWFWVYAVVTIALSFMTWGAWVLYNRRMGRSKTHDVESGSIS